MENFCPCCGVEYAEHKDGYIQVTDSSQFKDKEHNSIYKCKGDKKICYWCACILPCGIIDVVLGTKPAYMGYTKENFKTCPLLVARIKEVMVMKSVSHSCPSCGKEFFLKKSEYTGGIVRKCSCGWCD